MGVEFMITVCSAAANKILKKLNEDKDLLLSNESQGSTYSRYLSEDESSVVIPEYDFMATQKAVADLECKIITVKHAINLFNASTEIMPGLTIDAALVKMAMLTKRLGTLKRMRSTPKVSNSSSVLRGEGYRTYANFNPEEVNGEYKKLSDELNKIQLALDKANMVKTFDIDIDLDGYDI